MLIIIIIKGVSSDIISKIINSFCLNISGSREAKEQKTQQKEMLAEGSRQTPEINIFYWKYYCLMKDSNELERNFRIPPTCPHFLQDKLLRKSRSDRWHYPWSPTGPLLLKRMEMYKSTGLVSENEEEGLVHNPINIILSVNNDSNVNFLFTISSKQNLMWNLLTDPSLPINYEMTAAKVR